MNNLNKILLVEDSENDIELELEALAENNIVNEVEIVKDGEEAINYLFYKGKFENREKGFPAVILLDLKLPKIDGLEVLKIIKSDPYLNIIPVVVLTSSKEESDLVKSYELGVNAYVVKPIDFDEFIQAVKELGLFWAIINQPHPDLVKNNK